MKARHRKLILWLLFWALWALVICVLLLSRRDAVGAQTEKLVRVENPIVGEYIVVYNPVTGPQPGSQFAVDLAAQALAATYGGQVLRSWAILTSMTVWRCTDAQARACSLDFRVAYVQEQGRVYAVQETAAVQPSPPSWGLDRVDQRNLPLNQQYQYNFDAQPIHAYVIDTGVYDAHQDFEGRATLDFDAIGGSNPKNDCHGHGSHVSGTVGGKLHGIAKKVRIHGVRVLSCFGSGTFDQVAAGIDWVTANHIKPAVANMSLGASGQNPLMETAVKNSIAAGVSYSIAAGNSDIDADQFTPARVPEANTVAASDITDKRASFSNWGPRVDLFAPGVGITSVSTACDTCTVAFSGTSMAAPHVAGAIALMLHQSPGFSPAQVSAKLIAEATPNKITDPKGSPNLLLYTLFTNGPGLPPPPPTPTPTPTPTPSPSPTPPNNQPPPFNTPSLPSCTARCPGSNCGLWTGFLYQAGDFIGVQTPQPYVFFAVGTLEGWLCGPAGTDFSLRIWRWNTATKMWEEIKSVDTPGSQEYLKLLVGPGQEAPSGYFFWAAQSSLGGGSFWLGVKSSP